MKERSLKRQRGREPVHRPDETQAISDPTAGRSAGSERNATLDPTRGGAAGTRWNTEKDPTRPR